MHNANALRKRKLELRRGFEPTLRGGGASEEEAGGGEPATGEEAARSMERRGAMVN